MKILLFCLFSLFPGSLLRNRVVSRQLKLALKSSEAKMRHERKAMMDAPPKPIAAAPQINNSRIIVHQYEPPHTPMGEIMDAIQQQGEDETLNVRIHVPPPINK